MKKRKKNHQTLILTSITFTIALLMTILIPITQTFADTSTSFFGRGTNYVALKAGIISPTSNDLKDLGIGTSFNGEVALGHYFNDYFALELGVGYYQSSATISGSGSIGNDSYNGSFKSDFWVVPATLALKIIAPINQLELYALGGAGAYFANAKFDISGNATIGGTKYTGATSASSSATAFGGFLGGGANFNFTKHWYLGVEGKYLWTKPSFRFYGTDISADMAGWIATGNIGYKF